MNDSLYQRIKQYEIEEAEYQKKIGTILLEEGYTAADERRAGFEVVQYTALTFVFFKDPSSMYNNPSRIAEMKKYQESLKKNEVALSFYDEDPSSPYLCG